MLINLVLGKVLPANFALYQDRVALQGWPDVIRKHWYPLVAVYWRFRICCVQRDHMLRLFSADDPLLDLRVRALPQLVLLCELRLLEVHLVEALRVLLVDFVDPVVIHKVDRLHDGEVVPVDHCHLRSLILILLLLAILLFFQEDLIFVPLLAFCVDDLFILNILQQSVNFFLLRLQTLRISINQMREKLKQVMRGL